MIASAIMKIFYTDHYVLPLPPGHRFPMRKYGDLRERVLRANWLASDMLHEPHAASDEELARAHCADYVRRVQFGELDAKAMRRIGFPWTPEMVERSRRSSGATIEAAIAALAEGCGVNLAGGTHHAFRDFGEGFCVFNDSIVAARTVQASGRAQRIAIIDCDVHQGNGTASIACGDESIFTFSMHGANNFPFRKEISDLDIELLDGTSDGEYLQALARGVAETLERADPDLVIYLAGADPHEGDRLGRLKLTKDGLAARDEFVLSTLKRKNIPVAVTMAGGYGNDIADTVDIHFRTVEIAVGMFV
jgi:acetoin utilization deacetylase AcuC-like enzyme